MVNFKVDNTSYSVNADTENGYKVMGNISISGNGNFYMSLNITCTEDNNTGSLSYSKAENEGFFYSCERKYISDYMQIQDEILEAFEAWETEEEE